MKIKRDADIVPCGTAGALCTGKRKRAGTGEDSGHGSGYQRLWYGKGDRVMQAALDEIRQYKEHKIHME